MFFKNKVTGLVWEVVNPDHIKRCKNDKNYEEFIEKVEKGKGKETKASNKAGKK